MAARRATQRSCENHTRGPSAGPGFPPVNPMPAGTTALEEHRLTWMTQGDNEHRTEEKTEGRSQRRHVAHSLEVKVDTKRRVNIGRQFRAEVAEALDQFSRQTPVIPFTQRRASPFTKRVHPPCTTMLLARAESEANEQKPTSATERGGG